MSPYHLYFKVRFFLTEPSAQIDDEFTKYLYVLQIKKELLSGKMWCPRATAAILASYIVQSKESTRQGTSWHTRVCFQVNLVITIPMNIAKAIWTNFVLFRFKIPNSNMKSNNIINNIGKKICLRFRREKHFANYFIFMNCHHSLVSLLR